MESIEEIIDNLESELGLPEGSVILDETKSWSLYCRGELMNAPVGKFGAYRNYLGGGVRGEMEHNGREQEGTIEAGEKFMQALREIEEVLNEGCGDEAWEKNTGVLL